MAKKPKYYVRPDGLHEAIRQINGKRVAFRGKTDAEVERKMMAYQEKKERGPLFKEVAEKWHDEHFPTLSPGTLRCYTAPYNRAVDRYGDDPVKELTAPEIEALLQSMAKQKFARKTVANQRLVLNLIFRSAVLDGILKYNPCAEVKVPKGLKTTPRQLPSDEELDVVKNGKNNPDGLLPYLILYTGCRRGEALALTYKDIDRKKKIITINKSVTYVGQQPSIKEPKTAAGIREIILLDKLAEVLPRGIGLIFPGKKGELMHQAEYERRWKHWQDRVGVTLTAHQLRHGYATMLYEAGIPERDAMELLGHTDISLTHKVYTHIRRSRKEETAILLNQAAEKF
ncbi:MAG TPA: site-specific integrase [Syntrophomonas sp.]|nr:site-specific integrase [Syntrophomonas sp.]